MANLLDAIRELIPGARHLPLLFVALLLIHVPAALTCVVTGAGAAISPKRRERHPRFGTVYFWALSVVFASASGLAIIRWNEDRDLFALGTIAFALATVGYLARRIRWRGWKTFHILGMGASYAVLITAFYVDNGPKLPLLDRLPAVAFWTLPSMIAALLLVRALRRYTHLIADLRAALGALRSKAQPRSQRASGMRRMDEGNSISPAKSPATIHRAGRDRSQPDDD